MLSVFSFYRGIPTLEEFKAKLLFEEFCWCPPSRCFFEHHSDVVKSRIRGLVEARRVNGRTRIVWLMLFSQKAWPFEMQDLGCLYFGSSSEAILSQTIYLLRVRIAFLRTSVLIFSFCFLTDISTCPIQNGTSSASFVWGHCRAYRGCYQVRWLLFALVNIVERRMRPCVCIIV